jgi:pimeloyl-ACP methyl ester carboxylesterase
VPYIEVEPDVQLFYRDLGQGRPLVLLHGWTMTHQVWDRQVQDLAGKYRLILPDLRGHGDSDKPVGDYGPDRHAADIATLMEHLDLRNVTLIGWSFGGTTAIRTAARHGDRLSQLVLVNAAGPKYLATEDFPGHSEETLQEWLARERNELAGWRRFCMESMPLKPYDELFVNWLWMQSMRMPSWAGAPMLEAYARVDLRQELGDIVVPTLILHGVHDVFCALEPARYMAAAVPDAKLIEFTESGHSPQYEQEAMFIDELRRFLAQAPPGD